MQASIQVQTKSRWHQDLQGKACRLALGCCQQYGKNYSDTYAPVASVNTMKLVMVIAAANQWSIHHVDFETACINAELP